MKWLKILIYSLIIFPLIISQLETNAQYLSIRAGIYDFTDNVATEFYIFAPGVFIDYDIVNISRLKFNACLGFTFNSVKYDNHKHNLYFIPVFLSITYDLTNPESKFKPYIGSGFSLAGKADQNKSFDKTHYSATYGYHAIGGIRHQLKDDIFLQFDMRYNMLINSVMEEINMSGMILSAGVKLQISGKEKGDNE